MPKVKKFCKILKYIEQIDSELYQMIIDLCLERLFIPRGTAGITFLYPKEKSYREEILSYGYSEDPEKAIQMLESLILLDYLPKPEDFILKKDDIPNALRQKIDVKSADVSSVHLGCGCKLAPDNKFVPMEDRKNMAVYTLSGSGRIPLDAPKATMKYASKKRTRLQSKLGGGYEMGGGFAEFYNKVKDDTIRAIEANGQTDHMVNVVLSYLQYLKKNAPEQLRRLWHEGKITPIPLGTFFAAIDPLGRDPSDAGLMGFIGEAKQRNYTAITKNKDILTEYQSFVQSLGESKSDDSQRLSLQEGVMGSQTVGDQISRAEEAYKSYYTNSDHKQILKSHELQYLSLLAIFQSVEEASNADRAVLIREVFDKYKQMLTGGPCIVNRSAQIGFDTARKYSGLFMFIRSSLFLGGPLNGKYDDSRLGSKDSEVFVNPTAESGRVNLHAIAHSAYSEGMPSRMTVGGLREYLD